ncbi:centromere protein P [Amphiprion ocellaris]|uniref:Centromere protein P n=1 Tax=Amphiprion ocellaris TaxID=80972 RepID=A0A3Q1D670_AMPOC|nr:centromere protein P [Amphiprion ocellaris]XP_054866634.1 centromere protein P [Amphiprion ocellaris]XP_054866635.1 centromere protein P [Amphiprion ocellaris]XP_054866636.1 centromere protein P [Amphiprion ocellaris]
MSEENMEEVQMLEAQIERLQAEVEALQRQQQDNQKDITFQFRGQMQDAIASLCGRGPVGEKERVMSSLKEEVEEMEEDLRRQTQMNGITLNGCNAKTLRSSGSKVVQQLCLSGRCSELDFQVEFKLSEVKDGQKSQRTISDLNVVLDSNDLQTFSSFVSSVEESCDLLLFFRTLRTFSDRCDDRSRTFQHFQQKYPSVVSLPGGCRSEVMALSHAELSGCVLFVRWSIDVSREGGVSPNIELLTKIPDQALMLFPCWPVGGAAEAFQSLLRILGVEGAMESIIVSFQQEV